MRKDNLGYFYASGNTITADSVPVYTAMLPKLITPNAEEEINTDNIRGVAAWTGNDWIQWWNALNSKYGKDKANQIWGSAWLDGLDTNAGGRGLKSAGSGSVYDSVPLADRTFNNNFRDFLSNNQYLHDVVFNGLLGKVAEVESGTVNVGSKAVEVVGNVASAVSNTAKVTTWLLPTALIVGVGMVFFIAHKRYS